MINHAHRFSFTARQTIGLIISFALIASTTRSFAQPYSFDENGNGTGSIALNSYPLPFSLRSDPSGGITTSPVLIYDLGFLVNPGDVALIQPNQSGIADLLRFYNPVGASSSLLIFYSRIDGAPYTLADVGIPATSNPIQLTIGDSPGSDVTTWFAGGNQPGGYPYAVPVWTFFRYTITTDTVVPEPTTLSLLLLALGTGLAGRYLGRKGLSFRLCRVRQNSRRTKRP